jgi:hypothetical protein
MKELLSALRQGSPEDASTKVVELLNRGTSPQSLWDAIFTHAAEMLMRKPGIVSLHACTTANALHFAHKHTFNDETRRFLLLQAAAFPTLFRDRAGARDGIDLEALDPAEAPPDEPRAIEEIFSEVGRDRMLSARKTLAFLRSSGHARPFIDAAQRLIYLKGTDSHDYKFSSAVLEDFLHLDPSVRDRFLAASVFWLKGSSAPDSSLVARTRAALGA